MAPNNAAHCGCPDSQASERVNVSEKEVHNASIQSGAPPGGRAGAGPE